MVTTLIALFSEKLLVLTQLVFVTTLEGSTVTPILQRKIFVDTLLTSLKSTVNIIVCVHDMWEGLPTS